MTRPLIREERPDTPRPPPWVTAVDEASEAPGHPGLSWALEEVSLLARFP